MKLFSFVMLALLMAAGAAEAQVSPWKRLLDRETFGMCVNPLKPATMYVGGFGRRLYRTYDAGATWDTLVVEFVTATTRFTNVYVSPADTNVLLVAGLGFGTVRRSSDHGQTWSVVLETLSPFTASSETLVNDPHNPNTIYAADLRFCNIYRSYDRGITWDTVGSAGVPFVENLCTLAIRPDSSNIILAGLAGGVIKRSADSGKTWTVSSNLTVNSDDAEVPRIIFSKRNPLIGYAVVAYFFYENRPSGGVFRTTDGGYSWNRIGLPDTSVWTCAVRTRNGEDDLFVGGYTDDYGAPKRVPGYGIVQRSTNGGVSWLDIDNNIAWIDSLRKNAWMMKFADENDERLYMASERGFFFFEKDTVEVIPVSIADSIAGVAGKRIRITTSGCGGNSGEITVSTVLGKLAARRRVELSPTGTVLDFTELPAGVYTVVLSLDCGKRFGGVVMIE